MNALCEETIQPGWFTHALKPPQMAGIFLAKATCKLKPGGVAELLPGDAAELVCGDRFEEDDPTKALVYPSDFAPFKPNTDLTLLGTACTPQGKMLPSIQVGWQVGGWSKQLLVFGDRKWVPGLLSTRATEPTPFARRPIRFSTAFGGPASRKNPVGKGFGKNAEALPNVEIPSRLVRNPKDDIGPAGFGPVASEWSPRQSKSASGTYNATWRKKRWPWFPEDFDWSFFNAAPPDQQLPHPLVGDETLQFQHLHPDHPVYQTKLPGIRVRLFVGESETGDAAGFREVTMRLDALHVDMDEEKATLLWRGVTNVRSLKLREIRELFIMTESTSEPARDPAQCLALYRERKLALEGIEPAPVPTPEEVAEVKLAEEKGVALDLEHAQVMEEMAKQEAEARARAIAAGVDPAILDKPAAASFADLKAALTASAASLKVGNPEAAAATEAEVKALEEVEAVDAEMKAAEEVRLTREDVQQMVARGESLANRNLSELDLSDLQLPGVDLSYANLTDCELDGANLTGANLTRAQLGGADFTDANLTDATLDEADFTEAILDATKLARTSLNGTVFSELALAGFDFRGAQGLGADFSGADLTGAQFGGAKLPQTNFSGATLIEANFQKAELPTAQFEKVKAARIQMAEADLTGLHASDGSDFTGANFRRARADGAIWEEAILQQADFSGASLIRSIFNHASLQGAKLDQAELTAAVFDDANLEVASLVRANLLRASFDRANLSKATLRGANLYNAGFWDAVLVDTNFDAANLKATTLAL